MALDRTGSYDPDPDDTLTYAWATDCPGGMFDDATRPTPVLIVDSRHPCPLTCSVTLTVTDSQGAHDTCSATVTIQDTTAPVLTCPENLIVECDGAGNVGALNAWLNSFTASDGCDGVALSNDFTGLSDDCGATGSATVAFTATDDCGHVSACSGTFTIVDTMPPVLTVDTTPITVVDSDCSGDAGVTLPVATATDVCGSVAIGNDAPPTFPAGQTTTVTYTATDECGNANTATVNVTVEYGANIVVRAAKHVVGTGSHPDSTKEPLVGLEVCAYDKSDGSCARLTCAGISHQHYQCIVDECEPVNCAVANENGEALINLPPGDYIVIAADATKTVLPDPLGVNASDLMCGETQTKYLQQIVRTDGSKIPGKTTRLTGSELLIIEPEYVLWDDTEQLYPFVFETIGEWGVTVTVDPPEGFLADYELLSEDVDNELEAVQFTITELGSDLVPTGTTFQVHHNGRPHTVRSSVGIALTPEYALSRGFNVEDLRQRGLIKERRPVVDVPRRGRGGRQGREDRSSTRRPTSQRWCDGFRRGASHRFLGPEWQRRNVARGEFPGHDRQCWAFPQSQKLASTGSAPGFGDQRGHHVHRSERHWRT